ncbi:hypothetical protein [Streptacidiphilus sp. PAMC 29251]
MNAPNLRAPRTAAIYLRCYPFDLMAMPAHRYALHRLADQLGLPMPSDFLDNGLRSCGPLPALTHLIELAAQEIIRVVLVPGPFVFSVCDTKARTIVDQFRGLGCQVIELPPNRNRTCGRTPSAGVQLS